MIMLRLMFWVAGETVCRGLLHNVEVLGKNAVHVDLTSYEWNAKGMRATLSCTLHSVSPLQS